MVSFMICFIAIIMFVRFKENMFQGQSFSYPASSNCTCLDCDLYDFSLNGFHLQKMRQNWYINSDDTDRVLVGVKKMDERDVTW